MGTCGYHHITSYCLPISLTVTLNRSQLRLRTVFLNLSAIILNSLAYLSLTTLLAEKTALLSHFDGCAGIIGAAINFGIYLRYYLNKEDGPASNLLIILIAGFSLATILIQFSNPNIYIAGIGLEAAIASWLYSYSGKRIFKMAPLHHHFQKPGDGSFQAMIQRPIAPIPESKITLRFWIIGIILAAITFVTLKIR